MKNEKVWKIAMTGVFAALSYVVFTFLQFKIWLPGGDATSIHFGNAVCVLGALILGGVYGGIGGAIGMTIGDLLDPVYVVYAPKTFILKFCIGLIAGLIAHKIGKINEQTDQKQIFKWALLAAIGGLLFNVIFDPLIGYFYKLVLLGKPAAEVTLSWNVAATSINAVLSTIASVVIYMALRPALQKSKKVTMFYFEPVTFFMHFFLFFSGGCCLFFLVLRGQLLADESIFFHLLLLLIFCFFSGEPRFFNHFQFPDINTVGNASFSYRLLALFEIHPADCFYFRLL